MFFFNVYYIWGKKIVYSLGKIKIKSYIFWSVFFLIYIMDKVNDDVITF